MTTLLPLLPQDNVEIEMVLDAAFGRDRHQRTAYAIRAGVGWLAEFSYSLTDDAGGFIGLLQSWPVELCGDSGRVTPLIMVGPVAILPERQGVGFGKILMDRLIADADRTADAHLMMIGDPEYYGRFWRFRAEHTAGWQAPGPLDARRVLMRRVPRLPPLPALQGVLRPRSAG